MKKYKLFLVGCIAMGISSCDNSTPSPETHVNSEIENQHSDEILEEGLHLNDEEKWAVNYQTHEGMTKMKEIISEFKFQESENYKALGDSLEIQANFIIQNCDMKGEPHNQLHFVLHPILEEIEALKKDKESLVAMEKWLNVYFRYFEIKE